METKPTELSPPPIVSISLDYWLSLSCRGIDNKAIISTEFANYLRSIDPNENHIHIEPMPINGETEKTISPRLAEVYPITEWRQCVKRRERQKELSEASRQIRFAIEEEQKVIHLRIQRRRDILAEAIADVKKAIPGVAEILGRKLNTWNQKEAFLEYQVYKTLMGESPLGKEKFILKYQAITEEQVTEFTSLPRDPEWANQFFTGITKKD